MEIDALRIALLALCTPERIELHRAHGELEHWLNRQLASAELEVAAAELAAGGLIAVHGDAPVALLTTPDGRALVSARWEEFFPE